MSVQTDLLRGLRKTLLAVISDDPDNREVNRLVAVCHALAFASLRAKAAHGRLYQPIALDLSDVAYDCIAELFRQDEAGRLAALRAFFESIDLGGSTDEDLLIHLRRLVFSSVNQGVFRLYNELDPAAGKILRNIKLSIQSLQNFIYVDRLGEVCIAPSLCDPLAHRPMIEPEILRRELWTQMEAGGKIPAILTRLALFLRRQEEYSRQIPIAVLAREIRDIYARQQIPERTEDETGFLHLTQDLDVALQWAMGIVKKKAEQQYAGTGKVPAPILGKYFEAIENYLGGKLNSGEKDLSLSEAFSQALPEMRGEYKRIHRTRVEYLLRQIEVLVRKRLKE